MSSIVLLQNDPVVGERLRRAIGAEKGLQVTAMAGTLAQAQAQLDRGGCDLLVADLRLGEERLVEWLGQRRSRGLEGLPQVLVIAMSADDPHLMQALRRGAHGYFIHGSPFKSLARVIRQVLAGESPMSPPIARRLMAHFKQSGAPMGVLERPAAPMPALTEVERQMLNRVSQGYLLHEIAREMQTSEHSVGLRTRSLYRKLQLDLLASALDRQAA